MIEEVKLVSEGKGKRGRKKKEKEREEDEGGKEKYKFFVDLRDERSELEIINKMLKEVNTKAFGKEIFFKDLAVYAVTKLTPKDLEKIQDNSLSDMERIQKLLNEYNEKNNTSLSMGEFLRKKLNV